jgi:4-amino-4-deoxy-L-arabinose transferase
LAASAALLLLASHHSPLLDPDEARFARTSVEMLRSGDLVVPRFNGEPRLVKPPLLHWIQAFLFSLLGASEVAARLVAVLSTLGSALLVARLARRRFGDEAAAWSVAVLVTMPLVFVLGRLGTLDALLAVHVLAFLMLDLAEEEGDGGAYRPLASGGLLGLAFLVKGPVGVVLPLLVVLAGRTASGRRLLPTLTSLSQGLAAWSLVVVPWGLVFVHRVGSGTALGTLRREALERFFAGTTHVEPFWYYGPVVAVAFLPWLAPLLAALVRAVRLRREPSARTALYAAAGLVAGLVFFSLSQGKLPNYLLPLAPLVAILVVWELGREIEAPRERWVAPALLAASLAAVALLLWLGGATQLERPWRAVAMGGSLVYGVAALPALAGAIVRRPRWVYLAAALAAASFLLLLGLRGFPLLAEERSTARLIEKVPRLASGLPVVLVELQAPSLVFYLDRRVEVIAMDELESRLAREDGASYLFADVDLPDLPAAMRTRLHEIGRHGKYRVLLQRSAEADRGPPAPLDGPPGRK